MTKLDGAFWRGRRVFLTGHTGFKGSWLALWLHRLGAEVHGLALPPPTEPALFREARVETLLASHGLGDIRDFATVHQAMVAAAPEVVFHLAAQPLVRQSYQSPLETFGTNVMGTAHVLEAARHTPSVRAIVNVTTDKCYENREWLWAYREDEALGGHDPYSSSKAGAELVSSAYRRSFLAQRGIALATARAGNVIGGGDWAVDRLVPDILRAFARGEPVVLRHPGAIRPWQHVLEPLAGYLTLGQALVEAGEPYAEAWNFGPREEDARPVQWIVDTLAAAWGEGAAWQVDARPQPHEALCLKLDIAKARSRLGWQPRWSLDVALQQVVAWHRAWLAGADLRALCLAQIDDYAACAVA